MTIFALGDSIVKGFGVGEEKSFVNVNEKGIHTVNFGMNGATSDYGVSKLKDIYGDILVLYFGINDFLSNYSVDYVVKNLMTIFEYVDKEKLDIILCSPHRIAIDSIENWTSYTSFISTNNKLKEYNQKLKDISNIKNINF
ncbi:Lysophospholipase L1 [Anaerosphaera aminiphila DSM 21120]|uniref:Lysophospholipase L1 n=1 Tax=Anaerosphaera aminiphila DSM 21120 TaxID=1120995 RepID=A0A1M5PB07_9FIRM|nr:GDSL-type esterase/lipase family protein [Anaerosphaera aminiphila]SHG98629.1 Lysophospholipase L1 [Anaerosphaera aminiphila DSM 21120]